MAKFSRAKPFISRLVGWPWLAVGLAVSLSVGGCVTSPPSPAESTRANWGNMVVAPARYPPKSNFHDFAVGRKAGASKGAAAGAGTAFGATMEFALSDPLAALVAPYLLVVAIPVGAAAGAIHGAHGAISKQDAAALQTKIRESLITLQVSATLARAIVDTAQLDAGKRLPLLVGAGPGAPGSPPDLRVLARQGANSAMEVIVTGIGFIGHKRLHFYMKAAVRILTVPDGSTMYQREFLYESDDYPARKWAANQAALMDAELQRAYESLADSAVEQIFLLTSLSVRSRAKPSDEPHGFDPFDIRYRACGLPWVSPPHAYYPTFTGGPKNRFPKVSSLEPTLAWETFSHNGDGPSTDAKPANITDVRYDLRVWKATIDAPPRLVFQIRDLTSTFYKFQQPLEPDSRYFWSVRARFKLDGQLRGTKWAYFGMPGFPTSSPISVCSLDFIPTANYYRFQTPKENPETP